MTQCPLCLQLVPFLVLDHDHVAGHARGDICQACNNYLVMLEHHPDWYWRRIDRKRHRIWRRWVTENAERIREHLERKIGQYRDIRRARKEEKQRRKVSGSVLRVAKGAIRNLTTTAWGAAPESAPPPLCPCQR